MVRTGANGQPAFGMYILRDGRFEPFQLQVLELRDGKLARVTAFFDLRLFPLFGLPPRSTRTHLPPARRERHAGGHRDGGRHRAARARDLLHPRQSGLVTPGGLSRPTPCTGWDLAELLVHMDDSLAALLEAVLDRRVLLVPARRPGDDSFVATVNSLRLRACRLLVPGASCGRTSTSPLDVARCRPVSSP